MQGADDYFRDLSSPNAGAEIYLSENSMGHEGIHTVGTE